MVESSSRRVLIIGADGLRPDLLDPTLMPTVAALAQSGVGCTDHHAVYPTHTRVNISALATGTTPGQHGIVANTMLVPGATDDHIVDTSDYRHIQALEQYSHGQALLRPSLGDILAAQGERLAVAGTSTPGAAMLWTHRHLRRMVNTNSAFGQANLYSLREKLGEVPAKVYGPQIPALEYATSAVTELYLHDPLNRVIVLWLSEPDSSLHAFGLGSPESLQAMQAVDRCVAHVLGALDRLGLREQFNLFFLSDHGHSTVLAHNTLGEYLALAQSEIGCGLPPLTTASDYIYAAPDGTPPELGELAPLVEWLLAQPWTGIVLAGREDLATLPGVLPLKAVWNGHSNPRRPLLAVCPRWSHRLNTNGVPGDVQALTTQAALRSSHGSASPYDLHGVFTASGPDLRPNIVSDLPTGAVDLLPTILTLLDYPLPPYLDGRILQEILTAPTADLPQPVDEILEPKTPTPSGAGVPHLQLWRMGTTTYLHSSDR